MHCNNVFFVKLIMKLYFSLLQLPQKTLGKYDVKIYNIIPHPNYTSPMKYFDIALMELEYEVGFNQLVQPACLWSHSDVSKLGRQATMTGWGVPSYGNIYHYL